MRIAMRLLAPIAGLSAIFASSCATTEPQAPPEPKWAANGWLSPGRSGDPEIIGTYPTRAECEEAVADWLASQVVGNSIHGECLPIDKH